MRGSLKWDNLVKSLRDIGLNSGDTVFVQSRLFSFGLPEGITNKDDILDFHYSAFCEVIGPEGTLSVLSSFEDYGRYGTPYILEDSPSLSGVFSEHVRTRPGSIRSMHPIMSVTSVGKNAFEISGGPHYEGLGYDSPWGKLLEMNAKLMVYGGRFRDGMTFFHFLENLYGVPYTYTKIYNIPVISHGIELTGPFTMAVRYLDFGIENDAIPLEEKLLSEGLGIESPVGRTTISLTDCNSVIKSGFEALRENRYFFLKNIPKFREGEIPSDGPTGPIRKL